MNRAKAHEVLGVKPEDPLEDKKKAWKKLCAKYHPDRNNGEDTTSKMQEVNQAWDIVSGAKQADDEHQSDPFQRYQNGGFDPFAGFREAQRQAMMRGADFRFEMQIELEEAYHGCIKEIKLNQPIQKTIKVNIPKGIKSGQAIKLTGQGGQRRHSDGEDGDLIVFVSYKDHPVLVYDDNYNTSSTLNISFIDAIFGTEVEVVCLAGIFKVKVPSGASTGQLIRLPGKGFPIPFGNRNGDHFCMIEVVLPNKDSLTDEQKEIIHKISFEDNDKIKSYGNRMQLLKDRNVTYSSSSAK